MKIVKKVKKKSKNVLGRVPDNSFYVRETTYEELFPGGPKKPIEKIYCVDNFAGK